MMSNLMTVVAAVSNYERVWVCCSLCVLLLGVGIHGHKQSGCTPPARERICVKGNGVLYDR